MLVGSNSTAADGRLLVTGNNGSSPGGGIIHIQRSEASPDMSSGDMVGQVKFTDTNGAEFSIIQCQVNDPPSSGDNPGRLVFLTTPDGSPTPLERMRIGSTGNVGFNTDQFSGNQTIQIAGGLLAAGSNLTNEGLMFQPFTTATTGDVYPGITWSGNVGALSRARAAITAVSTGTVATASDLVFMTRSAADASSIDVTDDERMRINSGGEVLIGKTVSALATAGGLLTGNGGAYFTRSNDAVLFVNRLTNDGTLVGFYQDSNLEGTITVSGSTVQLNGAHLSRWSQLLDGEREEILRGTVLTNLDEMCEWAYDAEPEVLWAEGDKLPEGVSVGDVKTPAKAAGTESNEQLNRMKVSDVEGDKNIAGVFVAWDDDDDTYTNDFYCAMTGDFVIRIAQGVTVERGDLLMSAGDGTAKPQDDDIIRSKTIAKVTSTHVSCTYDDGSYCVPCVLMSC